MRRKVTLTLLLPLLSFLFPLNTVFADTLWSGSVGGNIYNANSGLVGIGINAPGGVLHVRGTRTGAGNQGQLLIHGIADHAYLQIYTSSPSTKETGLQLVGLGTIANPDWSIKEAANNNTLRFNYRGTDSVVVTSSGFVGIGTASPDTKLDVNGALRAGYDSDTKSVLGRAAIGAGGGYSDFAFFGHLDRSTSADGYAIMQNSVGQTYVNSSSGYPLDFRIGNVSKMYIGSDGKVGVGIATPSEKLEVNGNIKVHGNIVSDGTICIGSCN